MSNTIYGVIFISNTYKFHQYKSSDAKFNDSFDFNKHEFYNYMRGTATNEMKNAPLSDLLLLYRIHYITINLCYLRYCGMCIVFLQFVCINKLIKYKINTIGLRVELMKVIANKTSYFEYPSPLYARNKYEFQYYPMHVIQMNQSAKIHNNMKSSHNNCVTKNTPVHNKGV